MLNLYGLAPEPKSCESELPSLEVRQYFARVNAKVRWLSITGIDFLDERFMAYAEDVPYICRYAGELYEDCMEGVDPAFRQRVELALHKFVLGSYFVKEDGLQRFDELSDEEALPIILMKGLEALEPVAQPVALSHEPIKDLIS